MFGKTLYCSACGRVAKPSGGHFGSFLVDLLVWLLFGVVALTLTVWGLASPLAFSFYRMRTRKVCPSCRYGNMIPTDSPIAREHLNRSGPVAS